MPVARIIAIDGPAASGKTTLGQKLAEKLGYLFFDTGVMYRAVTWAALDRGVEVNQADGVTALAESLDIDVAPPSKQDERTYDVMVDGQDATWQIRSPQVDADVSVVSAYMGVRNALTVQQRRVGLRGNVVMVGRDIGTVVLPEADLKIFLDASVEQRARRRYDEMTERGERVPYETILAAMRRRDQIDSTRQVSPLRAAEDAVIINSDELSADEVLDRVLCLIGEKKDC
jgi:cytidylate kinase